MKTKTAKLFAGLICKRRVARGSRARYRAMKTKKQKEKDAVED